MINDFSALIVLLTHPMRNNRGLHPTYSSSCTAYDTGSKGYVFQYSDTWNRKIQKLPKAKKS